MNIEMTHKVWLLLKEKSAWEIKLAAYPNPIGKPLLDTCFVQNLNSGVLDSARYAAAVIAVIFPQAEACLLNIQLLKGEDNSDISGGSAGLAFALAFAQHLGHIPQVDIAATGEIVSITDGRVGYVEGINNKLEAAGAVLPPDGWVFYPEECQRELKSAVLDSLKVKGLQCHAVNTVDEALAKLKPPENKPCKKPWTAGVLSWVAGVVLVGLGLWWVWPYPLMADKAILPVVASVPAVVAPVPVINPVIVNSPRRDDHGFD